jgi:high-affinity Fe2+/Pb2+ permease
LLLFPLFLNYSFTQVYKIYDNTTPPELAALDKEMRHLCPSNEYANAEAPNGIRVNLTFRHAPELLGKVKTVDTYIHIYIYIMIKAVICILTVLFIFTKYIYTEKKKENEERFYHFASATRQFLETQKQLGTEAARQEAEERKQRRRQEKENKK